MLKFDEEKHEYTLNGKVLISVTQLLKKHGLAPDFSAVNEDVLNRKSEYGVLVHREIENYIKTGEIGFTTELDDFVTIAEDLELDLSMAQSEVMLHNDIVAGTTDLVFGNTLADYKTSSKLDINYVRWQLSVYAKLHGGIEKICVFHLTDKSKFQELDFIPDEEIEKLFECERNGELYQQKSITVAENTLQQIVKLKEIIEGAETAKKQLKDLEEYLTKEMGENNVKSLENDYMKITYIYPSERETIDSKSLKEKYPSIAEECTKKSKVKASVRITLR